jgi:hypothetical protein
VRDLVSQGAWPRSRPLDRSGQGGASFGAAASAGPSGGSGSELAAACLAAVEGSDSGKGAGPRKIGLVRAKTISNPAARRAATTNGPHSVQADLLCQSRSFDHTDLCPICLASRCLTFRTCENEWPFRCAVEHTEAVSEGTIARL